MRTHSVIVAVFALSTYAYAAFQDESFVPKEADDVFDDDVGDFERLESSQKMDITAMINEAALQDTGRKLDELAVSPMEESRALQRLSEGATLRLCSRCNIIVMLDLSRSLNINAIRKRRVYPKNLRRQIDYTTELIKLVGSSGGFPTTHFSLTAFSRIMGQLTALDNVDSNNEAALLQRLSLTGPGNFLTLWDYRRAAALTRKGNGYTHIGQSLKVNAGEQLQDQMLGDEMNTTIILHTDGRLERFEYRKNRPLREFRLSLIRVEREAQKLREEFGPTGLYIHCVLYKVDKWSIRFLNEEQNICDSVQFAPVARLSIQEQVLDTYLSSPEFCDANSTVLSEAPTFEPTSSPTFEPTSSPTGYPTGMPTGSPGFGRT